MEINIKFFTSLFIFLLLFIESLEKLINAYEHVPDSNNLQYRLGNGLGYIGNGWDDARMSNLSSKAGYDTQRKKLPEQHFANWGYEIEVGDAQTNTKLGILDVVGYLATPLLNHSSNASNNPELCYPANLYEPIFLSNGDVNPNINL